MSRHASLFVPLNRFVWIVIDEYLHLTLLASNSPLHGQGAPRAPAEKRAKHIAASAKTRREAGNRSMACGMPRWRGRAEARADLWEEVLVEVEGIALMRVT